MNNNNPQHSCPVCDCTDLETVGPIMHPRPTLVAGVPIDLGDTEYRLRSCQRCGFQFKDPRIDPARLLECYALAESDKWDIDPDPWQRQFDVLRDVLSTHARGRRILDIGCFNGALLKYLGDDWQKFGIEPSEAAAQLARDRNVNIAAPSLHELKPGGTPFDAILAIDVVEHIVDPLPFFRQVAKLLAPGGLFLVLTGNTAALSWRLQGSMYWYCSLPEHVSFYNRSSLRRLGEATGLSSVECIDLCHKRLPWSHWSADALKSAIYLTGRFAGRFGIRLWRRTFWERRGPTIQSAKDHLICVLRKQ